MDNSWKDSLKKNLKDWASSNTFKFAEGENTFRILPNKKGLKFAPVLLYLAHPNVGKQRVFVNCGKNLQGQGHCWLCDEKLPALLSSDKAGIRAAADKMRAIRQAVLQVSGIVDGKWRKPKPLLLTISKKALGNRILSFITTGTRAYDDPVKGFNLILERTGTGMTTQYGDLQAEESATKVPQAVLALIKPLEELAGIYSAENQKSALYGDGAAEAAVPDFTEEEAGEEVFAEEALFGGVEEESVGGEEEPVVEEESLDFGEETEPEAPPPQVKSKPKPSGVAKPVAKPAAKPVTKPTMAKPNTEDEEIVF